jgi:ankyrin repeat protein
VASAYRDSAGSVQALLDAGAEVKAPEGVRVKNTPLLLASMAGDLANVKLLLAHGAEPGAGLAQAVTFGYPEVVRALIGAGARATLTESSGINLLHWATITNRADVIPVLAEAKVPLNAIDDAGFTPIMYASTIDFGDAGVLKALLKAGADPKIRNDDKRTALEQARHFGHRELAAALK